MDKLKQKILFFANKIIQRKNLTLVRILKFDHYVKLMDLNSNNVYTDLNERIASSKDEKKMKLYEKWVETFLINQGSDNIAKLLFFFKESKSQRLQDLFVLAQLNFKENGFYVEFGATDGIHLSNTYLLEKAFKWKGILAEPAKEYHDALLRNRESMIETNCVWSISNEQLEFIELGVLSTIDLYKDADMHNRNDQKKYIVYTISLNDLLEKYNAPNTIDYLSIDTEGSEFEILSNFNFKKYKIKIITVEHNYTEMREKIFNLLSDNGYRRVYSDFSAYDDWYVLK